MIAVRGRSFLSALGLSNFNSGLSAASLDSLLSRCNLHQAPLPEQQSDNQKQDGQAADEAEKEEERQRAWDREDDLDRNWDMPTQQAMAQQEQETTPGLFFIVGGAALGGASDHAHDMPTAASYEQSA